MKIISAEFMKSVAAMPQLPKESFPQIAFVGRSNVGKSSLINCLLQRKKLAQTSSTPGKTTLLNFFLINGNMYFVDFPGYGFAKRSKEERERWGKLIEDYLLHETRLKAVLVLIDIRHGLSEDDRDFLAWLVLHHHAVQVIFTKADKLKYGDRKQKMLAYNKELRVLGVKEGIAFSIQSGDGKKELEHAVQMAVTKANADGTDLNG
jgi:GTP-binding protein